MTPNEVVTLRQELHSKPELSNSECGTVKIIKNYIRQYSPSSIIENIGGCGLAAVYKFPKPGKTITFRCELDALPIHEENHFSYKSTQKGISHKCGHDGHMAIIAGLAGWLNKKELDTGNVILLFQPAEETGEGAQRIINDPKFKELNTDYIFALHNIPKEAMHNIIYIESGFSAEVQSFEVILKGKESHAAEPQSGKNPALCLAQMMNTIAHLNVTDPEDEFFAILTPVHINMGQKSYGISPGKGEIHYTIRTWNQETMETLTLEIKKILKMTSELHGLEYEVNWFEYFPASSNDRECNRYVQKAAIENGFNIIRRSYPFKFGEDFGWYSGKYKTAMFGLGAGLDTPALHHADYDFPDEIIGTGIRMFQSIILNIVKESV